MVEAFLARTADAVSRRRRAAVAVWLVLLAGGGWFALHQGDHLSGGGWEVPGSPSLRVSALLERFPGVTPPTFMVLVTDPAGSRSHLQRAAGILAGDPEVQPGRPVILAHGRAALLPVGYAGATSNSIDEATKLRRQLVDAHTKVIGEPAIWSNFQQVSKSQLARGEELGFPLILLILLAAFGTVAAAAAPLALGFAAVFLTGAVIYWLSRSFEISVYVTNMASMIGIGVAVDYSLFIVSRFRRELHEGASEQEALRRALASSGTAVVFSGATVAVSLAALFAIHVSALRSMALGAIVVVCISVLAATTLLPALLSATGARIDRLRIRLPWRTTEEGSDVFWTRWAGTVMRHPVVGLVAGAGVLIAIASPVLAMKTLNRGLDELPRNSEVRVATERAQVLTGPGYASPVHIVVPRDPAAVARRVAAVPGVVSVAAPVREQGGSAWLVDARLAVEAESIPARHIVAGIRKAAGPSALIGGSTVFDQDVEHAVVGGLWKVLLLILATCYVVLFILLRNVLLPLKAVIVNLLSVGAAYGVLVAVFQWGWLDWIGYSSPGYVNTVVPALVLAVTFGLSMDYEVFLLTRIRERWLVHGDNDRAVAEGLVLSARIITSAAAIMVAVFLAFAIAGAPALKEMGVGLGAAIFLDATIVRLVVVPAAMRLLGPWNWWLPSFLSARRFPGRAHAA